MARVYVRSHPVARLLILTIILIAYGSLYPWHFRVTAFEHSPLWLMFQNWPAHLDALTVKDIAVNVLIYLPLGVFAVATFAAFTSLPAAISFAVLTGFGLSFAAELAQFFVVGRVSSLIDVATNTLGTALGAGAAVVWLRAPHHHTRRPDSIFLLLCWFLLQCFPFVPHWIHHRPISTASLVDTLWQFATTFALLPIVASLKRSEQTRRRILTGLLLLVPLRLLIFTRSVTLAEIAIAAAVLATGWWTTPSARYAAMLLAAVLFIHGLSPFTFQSTPHAFSWIPFQASFFSEWEPALTILLGKLFAYSAMLWLVRESGLKLLPAALITAAFLAVIEILQMFLPGRSSEITDPIIAILVSWVFASLRDQSGLKSVHVAR